MGFLEDDLRKFYELYQHLDLKSTYIGVVGSDKKFNIQMQEILNKYKKLQKQNKNIKIIINKERQIYRILIDDIEYNYLHIIDYRDLTGRYFRKYI